MATTPIYMTMGIHTEDGAPKTPTVKFHGNDLNAAERQYCLFRASAATSAYETDTAVLMTAEGFVLESKTYHHTAPEPEPTPEPEPEPEEPEEPEDEPGAEGDGE